MGQTRIKKFIFSLLLPRFVSDRHYVKSEEDGLSHDEVVRRNQIRNHRLTRIFGRYATVMQTLDFIERFEKALDQIAIQIRNTKLYLQKDVALLNRINAETLAGFNRVKQDIESELQFASGWLQSIPQNHFLSHVLRQRECGRTGLMTGWYLSKVIDHFKDQHGNKSWKNMMDFLNDESNKVYRPTDLTFPMKNPDILQQRLLRFERYCKDNQIENTDFIKRLHGDWSQDSVIA